MSLQSSNIERSKGAKCIHRRNNSSECTTISLSGNILFTTVAKD